MLTDKEREWLANRTPVCCKSLPPKSFDGYPQSRCPNCKYNLPRPCSIYRSDYRDAAEFEARAKVIALHLDIEDVPCAHGMMLFCPAKHFKGKGCGDWCRMRMAHLQAEKEMDNERNFS